MPDGTDPSTEQSAPQPPAEKAPPRSSGSRKTLTEDDILAVIEKIGESVSRSKVDFALKTAHGHSVSPDRIGRAMRTWRSRQAEVAAASAVARGSEPVADQLVLLRALSPAVARTVEAQAEAAAAAKVKPEVDAAKAAAEKASASAAEANANLALAKSELESQRLKLEQISAERDTFAAINTAFEALRIATESSIASISLSVSERLAITEAKLAAHDACAEERRAAVDQVHSVVTAMRNDVEKVLAKQTALASGIATGLANTSTTAADARDHAVAAEVAIAALASAVAAIAADQRRSVADMRTTISTEIRRALATAVADMRATAAADTRRAAASRSRR